MLQHEFSTIIQTHASQAECRHYVDGKNKRMVQEYILRGLLHSLCYYSSLLLEYLFSDASLSPSAAGRSWEGSGADQQGREPALLPAGCSVELLPAGGCAQPPHSLLPGPGAPHAQGKGLLHQRHCYTILNCRHFLWILWATVRIVFILECNDEDLCLYL